MLLKKYGMTLYYSEGKSLSEIIQECTEPVLIKYDSFEGFIARDDKAAIINIEKHL